MKYAKKVYACDGGVTIHPPKVIWESMGYPEYVEFVMNADGTCKLVPRRLGAASKACQGFSPPIFSKTAQLVLAV